MQIKINGAVSDIPDALSIQDLMRSKDLLDKWVVVVLNADVVKAEQWPNIKLNPDDNLEIVRLIGGG